MKTFDSFDMLLQQGCDAHQIPPRTATRNSYSTCVTIRHFLFLSVTVLSLLLPEHLSSHDLGRA